MSKESKLLSEKLELENKLAEVDRRLDREKGNKYAKCEYCHKRTVIRRLIYIQTHWYTSPSGCTGGDYWNQGRTGDTGD